jgi:hypothetical protein
MSLPDLTYKLHKLPSSFEIIHEHFSSYGYEFKRCVCARRLRFHVLRARVFERITTIMNVSKHYAPFLNKAEYSIPDTLTKA